MAKEFILGWDEDNAIRDTAPSEMLPTSEWSPTIGRPVDYIIETEGMVRHTSATIGQPTAANSNEVSDGVLWDYPSVRSATSLANPNYTILRDILDAAYNHAATGKGKERHARDLPFDEQPMMTTARQVGVGFPLGQAIKKAGESAGMIERGQLDAAEAECLGAINYLAGAVLWMREQAKEAKAA